jgi:hypothetical protein
MQPNTFFYIAALEGMSVWVLCMQKFEHYQEPSTSSEPVPAESVQLREEMLSELEHSKELLQSTWSLIGALQKLWQKVQWH